MSIDLTQEEIKELFEYNPQTGHLIWKVRPLSHFYSKPAQKRWNTIYAGKVAGSYRVKDSYRRVTIYNTEYIEHRLIWKLVYGEDCDRPIDHINHIRSDNRLSNLRKVTNSENQKNKSLGKNNKSGCVGVSFTSSRVNNKPYYASIRGPNGSTVNLGYYDHLFEAVCARKAAEIVLGYHNNHGKRF